MEITIPSPNPPHCHSQSSFFNTSYFQLILLKSSVIHKTNCWIPSRLHFESLYASSSIKQIQIWAQLINFILKPVSNQFQSKLKLILYVFQKLMCRIDPKSFENENLISSNLNSTASIRDLIEKVTYNEQWFNAMNINLSRVWISLNFLLWLLFIFNSSLLLYNQLWNWVSGTMICNSKERKLFKGFVLEWQSVLHYMKGNLFVYSYTLLYTFIPKSPLFVF